MSGLFERRYVSTAVILILVVSALTGFGLMGRTYLEIRATHLAVNGRVQELKNTLDDRNKVLIDSNNTLKGELSQARKDLVDMRADLQRALESKKKK